MTGQQEILRYLDEAFTEPVRDPLWGHIHLTPALLSLVDTGAFQQLSRIRQLGPTYLVYPGATHTRLNHSLGVLHLARRLLQQLLRHPETPRLSLQGVRSFLAAALLHDLGHFPYTHSFKSLPLREHEELTGLLVQSGEMAHKLRHNLEVAPETVAAIVDTSLPAGEDREIPFYRSLLSGSLDPDKLDYLNRDAFFCGVPYGIQDVDFALARLVPAGDGRIGVDQAGVAAVETVLFSKYLMYRAVYWHRTVRVATAMIKNAVYRALQEGVLVPEELYGLDDELLLSRLDEETFPPFELIRRVGRRDLLKPLAEIPFSEKIPGHRLVEDNRRRQELEAEIARDLRGRGHRSLQDHQVLLDLPDAISFEADLPVLSREVSNFSEESVFSPSVVSRFTATLRKIRLVAPPETARTMGDPLQYLQELLHGR